MPLCYICLNIEIMLYLFCFFDQDTLYCNCTYLRCIVLFFHNNREPNMINMLYFLNIFFFS